MLWLSDRECAIWLMPLDVRPQCDRHNLHKPFVIFAIGPAKCTAPVREIIKEILC